MNVSEAVASRINELLVQKHLTLYKLGIISCIPHETIKSIMKGKARGVNLKTVIAIADGFGMSISEFLDTDLFRYDNLELD